MREGTRRTDGGGRWLVVAGVSALALGAAAHAAPSDPPLSGDEIVKVVVFGGGIIVAALFVIFSSTKSMVKAKEREQTKRELAAYIAEGSMKAEDAERILKADVPFWEKDGKAWGVGD